MTTQPTNHGFTQVWNALIVDHRLSANAFRVAVYLASKTPDWVTRERNVTETLGIGKAAYRAAMRELSAAGYIERGKRSQDSKTGHWHSEPSTLIRALIVADPTKAQVAPKTDFRTSGEPTAGQPNIGASDNLQNTDNSTLNTKQEERSSVTVAAGAAPVPVVKSEGTGDDSDSCPFCPSPHRPRDLQRHVFKDHFGQYHQWLFAQRKLGRFL